MIAQEIIDRVRLWQQRLRLVDWDITVDLEKPPDVDTSLADCGRARDYLEATIRFAPNWREWTEADCQLPDDSRNLPAKTLDHLVVHELLHIAFHDLHYAGRVESGLLSDAVDRQHETELDRQVERAIEKLVGVLCEAFA